MARSAINIGFPSPNYVVELGNRSVILPGFYLIEQGALNATLSATPSAPIAAATVQVIVSATL